MLQILFFNKKGRINHQPITKKIIKSYSKWSIYKFLFFEILGSSCYTSFNHICFKCHIASCTNRYSMAFYFLRISFLNDCFIFLYLMMKNKVSEFPAIIYLFDQCNQLRKFKFHFYCGYIKKYNKECSVCFVLNRDFRVRNYLSLICKIKSEIFCITFKHNGFQSIKPITENKQ